MQQPLESRLQPAKAGTPAMQPNYVSHLVRNGVPHKKLTAAAGPRSFKINVMRERNDSAGRRRPAVLICLLLVLGTLLVYGQVCWSGFVNYDDPIFVTDNPHVQGGLNLKGLWWALTTRACAHWHPLTWISLQLDWGVYAAHAWGYHLTNLMFHCANTVLLFSVLRRMTGAAGRSAFVAALFAIHPLHVESVAWVSERKDVLSGFFWMLALWAYAGYAERQSLVAYLLVVAAFCLGLMAKAMVVTLPCVLLLMDYWPLGRVGGVQPHSLSDLGGKRKGAGIAWLVLEKAPLFGLAAAASVTTLLAQYDGRLETPPAEQPERIATALRAYQAYLMKTIYPTELMAFYPHPESGSQAWSAGAAASLLGGVTLLALSFGDGLIFWWGGFGTWERWYR